MDGDLESDAGAKTFAAVVGERFCGESAREMTVRKTSLFYPGDGYAAYDHRTGELVFRVDTYGRGPSIADSLVLMDPAGAPILTVRRKWPSLHQRWEGFAGERTDGQKPIFTVRRSSIFGHDRGVIDVETGGGEAEYRIEGSFAQRRCRVVYCGGGGGEGEEEVAAEIGRKVDGGGRVVLGRDVFRLCVGAGFDSAFAMGLVLVLDQISGDGDGGVDSAAVAPVDDDDGGLDGDGDGDGRDDGSDS